MKILLLTLLVLSSGCVRQEKNCWSRSKIKEIGMCTNPAFLESGMCRVVLENGRRLTVYAPTMVGDIAKVRCTE